ncbi:MAG TPA: DUF481 domain-containing protein [Acidobacteriaceae bacterium]|nr:DUF481 domain-containing protein [Acidobacteriaceae bacterium]
MRIQANQFRLSSQLTSILPCFLVAGCLFPALPTQAADAPAKPGTDVLVFSNGDKLTGKLDHEEGGSIYFASDNAGTVTVPWDKLKELHTQEPFAVIETGAKVARKRANSHIPIGTISVDGDTLTVTTSSGTRQIPVKNIAYIVDQPTFAKNVFKKQGFTEGITASISAGASTVNSTQNGVSVNTAVVLSRAVPPVAWMPPRQRTLLNFSSNYGKVTQANTPTVKTNILHAGIEEDEYLNLRFYLLQQGMWDHNYSQGLDLQQLYGGGVGYTAIKNAQQELDFTGIIDYTKQSFSASLLVSPPTPAYTHNIIGSSFGDNYLRTFPKKIVFTEVAAFNPAWNLPSDYSANVALGANFPVFKNFGFSLGLIDSYLNDPPAGFKGNSVQFNTGLTYAIQH